METRNDLIPIGSFAAKTQLSIKALRLYDKLELLTPAHTDPDSGYRYYAPEQARQAKLIFLMRRMEMPLAAIRHVLQATDSEAGGMLKDYQQDFECRLERNRRLLRDLLALLQNEEINMNFEVRTERVPALTIAGIKKHVKIDGLENHIHHSIQKLQQTAGPRIEGDFFGIYHGEVSEDSDGPMEVCASLVDAAEVAGAEVRTLAETDAAVVDVPSDQCHFPAILAAYDAAFAWVKDAGKTCANAPREVWLCDGDDMRVRIVVPYT
jgi:DNA-binding transcriptional MerR regulator